MSQEHAGEDQSGAVWDAAPQGQDHPPTLDLPALALSPSTRVCSRAQTHTHAQTPSGTFWWHCPKASLHPVLPSALAGLHGAARGPTPDNGPICELDFQRRPALPLMSIRLSSACSLPQSIAENI